jgi:hypothetical protein
VRALLLAILIAPAASAAEATAAPNIVLVTLDGVRWQDILDNKPDAFLRSGDKAPTFPGFWGTLAAQGALWKHAEISNGAVLSLPAYQSIFAVSRQPCKDNECARVAVETFPERLIRELALPKSQVAAFASWDKIPLAFESVPGTTFTDAGDAGATRWDATTFPKALAYLKAEKPRFLYISLNDPDHWGHAGDYAKYLDALRQSDAWLVELAAALDAMGDYGANTTLIVTTDHGRGVLWDWRSHGGRPWAKRIWIYARNPRAARKGLTPKGGTHADLRPTIEFLLGLTPTACSGCGHPLAEALTP